MNIDKLRPKSWVFISKRVILTKNQVKLIKEGSLKYEPIEIDEKKLEYLGFGTTGPFSFIDIFSKTISVIYTGSSFTCYFKGKHISNNIKYVHQLQNVVRKYTGRMIA